MVTKEQIKDNLNSVKFWVDAAIVDNKDLINSLEKTIEVNEAKIIDLNFKLSVANSEAKLERTIGIFSTLVVFVGLGFIICLFKLFFLFINGY